MFNGLTSKIKKNGNKCCLYTVMNFAEGFFCKKMCLIVLLLTCAMVSFAAGEQGLAQANKENDLLLRMTFDDGKKGETAEVGSIVKDYSWNGNDGVIYGNPKWVEGISGLALELDGDDSFVTKDEISFSGAITVECWIKAEDTYSENVDTGIAMLGNLTSGITRSERAGENRRIAAYIAGGGNRIDASIELEKWQHIMFTYDEDLPNKNMKLYINGALKASKDYKAPFSIWKNTFVMGRYGAQYFHGAVDEVKIYGRALSEKEVISSFLTHAITAGKPNEVKLTSHLYADHQVVVVADFNNFVPVPTGYLTGEVGLFSLPDGREIQKVEKRFFIGPAKKQAFVFRPGDLGEGDYKVIAVLKDEKNNILFHNPVPMTYEKLGSSVNVVSPDKRTLPSLPFGPNPVPYRLLLSEGGGFVLQVNGEDYPVESFYSYPYGGENRLTASSFVQSGGEPDWKVTTTKIDVSRYEVKAEGKYKAIDRVITLYPNHVNIQDRITNKGREELGIILGNEVKLKGKGFSDTYFAGYKRTTAPESLAASPTVFLRKDGLGLGVVALDDVYIVQSKGKLDKEAAGIYTDNFVLDKNASYILEWSIYLNTSGDYFDFINEVRKDEGRNGTIDGFYTFITNSPSDRRGIPAKERVDGVKYGGIHCLSFPADDKEVSTEGIDVLDFPQELKLLKEQCQRTHQLYPDLKIIPHIAHSLYATNKPEERFPDSRVIWSDGKHADFAGSDGLQWYYTGAGRNYFSKRRVDDGWRWWIYYPTMDNSFGKALLKSVDTLMDEIGFDGFFMDGFIQTYGGSRTYDRWDGHSAEIDPQTKTIKRKFGSVLLLSQDALVAFSRKVHSKGGVVIANNQNAAFTRTMCKEKNIIYNHEGMGEHYDLAPTPVSLGPAGDDLSVYYGTYEELKVRCLSFIYVSNEITRKPASKEMFPITFEEIRPGYVKGRERLITIHPGLYGWRGDRDLHFCQLYDNIGYPVRNAFLTTADGSMVRTQVELKEMEMAIVKRIPVSLETPTPVNLNVQQYNREGIHIILNGEGEIKVNIRDGDFLVKPNTTYLVLADAVVKITSDKEGVLLFPLVLKGELPLQVQPANP